MKKIIYAMISILLIFVLVSCAGKAKTVSMEKMVNALEDNGYTLSPEHDIMGEDMAFFAKKPLEFNMFYIDKYNSNDGDYGIVYYLSFNDDDEASAVYYQMLTYWSDGEDWPKEDSGKGYSRVVYADDGYTYVLSRVANTLICYHNTWYDGNYMYEFSQIEKVLYELGY